MLLLLIGDSMDMLDNIRATLGVNNNLSPEIKNDIFELVVIFNKKFPDVDLTRLRSRLSSLKIEKLNRFLNNDVSMYDNRTNTLYLNSSKLTDEYDGKHILMFELLNMISSNDTQMGFNRDGRFEALNIGYTEILANFLVGYNTDKVIYQEQAIETNLISIVVGSDTMEKAYFNNDTDLLIQSFVKAGVEL